MPCGTYVVMTADDTDRATFIRNRGARTRRVAIVEKVHPQATVMRIDARLKSIKRVVKVWPRLPTKLDTPVEHDHPVFGIRHTSSYLRTLEEAEAWVRKLNDPLCEHLLRHDPPEGFVLEPPESGVEFSSD